MRWDRFAIAAGLLVVFLIWKASPQRAVEEADRKAAAYEQQQANLRTCMPFRQATDAEQLAMVQREILQLDRRTHDIPCLLARAPEMVRRWNRLCGDDGASRDMLTFDFVSWTRSICR